MTEEKQVKPKKTKKKVIKNSKKGDYRTILDIKVGDTLVYPSWYEVEEGEDLLKECDTEFSFHAKDSTQSYEAKYVVAIGKIRLRAEKIDQVVDIFVDSGDSGVVVIQ